jgi:acyl-CoA thioesterase I
MPRILIFGASIVWGANDFEKGGWVDRFKVYFMNQSQSNQVYNLGVSGHNSSQLLARIEQECFTRLKTGFRKVNSIIIHIGTNDAQYLESKKGNQIDQEQFKKNLLKIIKIARKFSDNLFFVSILPCDESRTCPIFYNKDHFHKNENVEKYNNIIKEVCKTKKLGFIDVFSEFKKKGYKDLLEDGLHPNDKGHELIFQEVKDFLEKNKII